ncbi:MAG TPA: hypothetical protein VHM90_15605, partial [Phycisphaerae bacterium]|nr:hypothetical protein [Phycisphaerae bacterium]
MGSNSLQRVAYLIIVATMATGCAGTPRVAPEMKRSELRQSGDASLQELAQVAERIYDESTRIASLETRTPRAPGHIVPVEMREKSPETYGEEQ